MGRTACKESQFLYKGALYLLLSKLLHISWNYFKKFTLRRLYHLGNGSWYIHVVGG